MDVTRTEISDPSWLRRDCTVEWRVMGMNVPYEQTAAAMEQTAAAIHDGKLTLTHAASAASYTGSALIGSRISLHSDIDVCRARSRIWSTTK